MQHRLFPLFETIQSLRDFFTSKGFIDVLTPPMVENPGMEVHLHPFQVFSKHKNQLTPYFLHTSPEFAMKKLLSQGMQNIFSISYCFRDEPNSRTHRPQFLMLEWYRKGVSYETIMQDCKELVSSLSGGKIQVQTMSVREAFIKFLSIDLYDYQDKEHFYEHICENHSGLAPLKSELNQWSWDDLFFLLFLNEIEPKLKDYPALILKEYPSSQAALAKIKKSDPKVCERFELYMNGLEVANCFHEETSKEVIQERFEEQSKQKKNLYNYQLPMPNDFFETMKNYPESSGIALGVERLAMALNKREDLFWDESSPE